MDSRVRGNDSIPRAYPKTWFRYGYAYSTDGFRIGSNEGMRDKGSSHGEIRDEKGAFGRATADTDRPVRDS